MTVVLWLIAGLVGGVVVERVVGAPSDRADDPAAPRPRRRRRSRARIALWVGVGLVTVLVATLVGGYLWASAVFDRIDKVEVSEALSPGGGGSTNYLLIGSDNGLDPEAQRDGVELSRSDTIMVLRVSGDRATMLSLNRDLWVTNPRTGEQGRINATYQDADGRPDPANLIRAVTDNYGIPIHRYIEIDYASFGGLVDAFGGIDVDFPHPAFDRASGLNVPEAGRVHLDGEQALAFVRSRRYTEVIDGREVPDPSSDLGRVQRQQQFLRELMSKAGDRRNPFTLMSAADKMAGGLRIDDDMSMLDAARFAWSMGRLNPESVVLPTVPVTRGRAQVLEPGPGAEEVLDRFR